MFEEVEIEDQINELLQKNEMDLVLLEAKQILEKCAPVQQHSEPGV